MTITPDDLAATLAEAADRHHVPGAAAGVVVDDRTITAAHGVTNAKLRAAVSSGTLFQVGSVSKTIASAAVMLLVQDGLVALDDPVARHLPDLGPATGLDTEAITVEMTLSHQAGFDGDHLFVERSDDLADLAGARRLFEPGHGFSYSNAGFSIAGAVVAAVSGGPYDTFVRNRLFGPLGMATACFTADDAITRSVAAPHWVFEGTAHVLHGAGWQPGWELQPVDWAPAGVIASLDDLLTWCRFQWTGTGADGREVLSRDSLDRVHTAVVRADPETGAGLDWDVETIGGATVIGHGGVTVGYVTDLRVVTAERFGFVGLTNATNGAAVNQAVRRWVLEQGLGVIERDPAPDPVLAATLDVGRYGGRYLHSFSDLEVTAGDAPGTIVLTASARADTDGWQPPIDDPVTFGFVAPDHAVSIDSPGPVRHISFDVATDGPAAWVQVGGRRARRAG